MSREETRELFERLTMADAAPGFEDEVRLLMCAELDLVADEIVQDRLGGIFGVKKGPNGSPKVLVAGHMDEVSFMVTRVTKEGFVKFQPLGGWWDQVLLAQRVRIATPKGKVPGVIGSIPPHLLSEEARDKPVKQKQMFIDVGARSQEEAEEMGIAPGQPIYPSTPFEVLGNPNRWMGKAIDNRYGCALAIELLQEVKEDALNITLYSGAHVQEEVGLRGAAVTANLVEPDLFFALDAGPAGDIPGVKEGFGELGKGVLIRIMDRSMITLPRLRDYILDTAEAEGIPYQFFVSSGGTDAGRVHLSGQGVPSAVIGICARYIHSHASIMDVEDYLAAKKLLVSLIRGLDHGTIQSFFG